MRKFTHSWLAASVMTISASLSPAFGLIVPDAQDSSTDLNGYLTPLAGTASTLTVSTRQTALLQFNVGDYNIVPQAFWQNRITNAHLVIFIADVESPGDLTVHTFNNSVWNEGAAKKTTPPDIDSTTIATIPAAELIKNHSIVIDVTSALNGYRSSLGIAIETSSPQTKVKLVSKEGVLQGPAPILDLQGSINLSNDSYGDLIIGDSESNAIASNSGNDTLVGDNAALHGGIGTNLTIVGSNALYSNTDSSSTTATGAFALYSSTSNQDSTVAGAFALCSSPQSNENTVIGAYALYSELSGTKNTVIGKSALYNVTNGTSNIAIGDWAGSGLTSGSGNIYLGSYGEATDNNTIRIGTDNPFPTNTYVAGIYGTTAASGVAVYVDASGHLGTLTSSQKFKRDIAPMGEASDAILALKPVTFRYKPELDPAGIPQFGLVAEEVAKVDPDLVARDAKGGIYTVRYEAVNAMLLNEFLKEHQLVQELQGHDTAAEQKIAEQQREIRALSSRLTEVDTLLKKVARQMDERENGKPYADNGGAAAVH
ncbi:MAG: tail fiber domain-containing protein [Chthoniobacteraceae bacterium]